MTDMVEFDRRVDAFKPPTLSHFAWRASSARSVVAGRLAAKEAALAYTGHLAGLAALSRNQNEGE